MSGIAGIIRFDGGPVAPGTAYDPDEILKSSEQLQMEQLAAQLAQQGPPGGELPPGGGATLPPEQAALPATTA